MFEFVFGVVLLFVAGVVYGAVWSDELKEKASVIKQTAHDWANMKGGN